MGLELHEYPALPFSVLLVLPGRGRVSPSPSPAEHLDPIPPYLDQASALVAPSLKEAQGAVAEVDGWETGLPEDV